MPWRESHQTIAKNHASPLVIRFPTKPLAANPNLEKSLKYFRTPCKRNGLVHTLTL